MCVRPPLRDTNEIPNLIPTLSTNFMLNDLCPDTSSCCPTPQIQDGHCLQTGRTCISAPRCDSIEIPNAISTFLSFWCQWLVSDTVPCCLTIYTYIQDVGPACLKTGLSVSVFPDEIATKFQTRTCSTLPNVSRVSFRFWTAILKFGIASNCHLFYESYNIHRIQVNWHGNGWKCRYRLWNFVAFSSGSGDTCTYVCMLSYWICEVWQYRPSYGRKSRTCPGNFLLYISPGSRASNRENKNQTYDFCLPRLQ